MSTLTLCVFYSCRKQLLHRSQYHSHSGAWMLMRTHMKHIIDVSIATCRPDAHESTHNIRIVHILVSDDVSLLFSSAAASLDIVCEVYLTKVHKPDTRCTSSKSLNEIYGFRPLGNSPFALLSAFEFLQHWDADAISYPSGKKRGNTQNGHETLD